MIDLHCHILPGLDDGAKNIEEALEMARIAQQDGIKKIVATFHLFRGKYLYNNFQFIEEKRKKLSLALGEKGIDVEIFLGAEVYVVHNLMDEIRTKRENLAINRSSYMFLEFPQVHVFSGVRDLFFELMSEGITPIIAHPERNYVFMRNPTLFYGLVQMGALAQANSGSFLGLYGKKEQETSLKFLEWNLIHFIASDSHSPRRHDLLLSGAVKRTEMLWGKDKAAALVMDNPQAVLNDKEIPFLFDPIDPGENKKKFNIKIPSFFKIK